MESFNIDRESKSQMQHLLLQNLRSVFHHQALCRTLCVQLAEGECPDQLLQS